MTFLSNIQKCLERVCVGWSQLPASLLGSSTCLCPWCWDCLECNVNDGCTPAEESDLCSVFWRLWVGEAGCENEVVQWRGKWPWGSHPVTVCTYFALRTQRVIFFFFEWFACNLICNALDMISDFHVFLCPWLHMCYCNCTKKLGNLGTSWLFG